MHAQDIVVGLFAGFVAVVASLAFQRNRRVPLGAFLLGGWLFALAAAAPKRFADAPEPRWMLAAGIIAVVGMAWALSSFDRRHVDAGLTPILLLVTIGGAFLTTPDTEVMVLLGAAAAPIAVLSVWRAGPYLGWSAAPLAAVLIWTMVHEARGRPASLLAALACWGFLALEPVVQLVRRVRWGAQSLIVGHTAFAVLAARGAGLDRDGGTTALKLALLTSVAGVFVLVAGGRDNGGRAPAS
jgi:hypothetical protein